MHGADALRLRFEHDFVVGGIRNRASGRDCGQARAATRAHETIDCVAVDISPARSAPGREAVGEHAHDGGEVFARQLREWVRAGDQREQFRFAAFAAGHLRDDLLGEHIQRILLDMQGVEFAAAHRVEQCRAFDQVIARSREQACLWHAIDLMVRAAGALQEGRDRARRGNLADEVDVADIDAQFQRGSRDQRAQFAALEALLGGKTLLARERTVMRSNSILAKQFG